MHLARHSSQEEIDRSEQNISISLERSISTRKISDEIKTKQDMANRTYDLLIDVWKRFNLRR